MKNAFIFHGTAGHPKENWFQWLKRKLEKTILVGHSLGGLFLLRLLEKLNKPVHTAVFIATSIGIKPINTKSGYTTFPELYTQLKDLL